MSIMSDNPHEHSNITRVYIQRAHTRTHTHTEVGTHKVREGGREIYNCELWGWFNTTQRCKLMQMNDLITQFAMFTVACSSVCMVALLRTFACNDKFVRYFGEMTL